VYVGEGVKRAMAVPVLSQESGVGEAAIVGELVAVGVELEVGSAMSVGTGSVSPFAVSIFAPMVTTPIMMTSAAPKRTTITRFMGSG
jgi:hypothetical protein